jgi:hypothetical protein
MKINARKHRDLLLRDLTVLFHFLIRTDCFSKLSAYIITVNNWLFRIIWYLRKNILGNSEQLLPLSIDTFLTESTKRHTLVKSIIISSHNYYSSPHSGRVLFNKLIVAQWIRNFSAFYGIRNFNCVFARTRHWALSSATWIQSASSNNTPSEYISTSYIRPHIDIPSSVPPSDFPKKKLCTHFSILLSCYMTQPLHPY